MRYEVIAEDPRAARKRPDLDDDDRVCARSWWAEAPGARDGLPGGRGPDIAHEAVGRHAAGPRRDRSALRRLGKRAEVGDPLDPEAVAWGARLRGPETP